MNPSRRGFLRSVGAIAVASAFPLPAPMENPCRALYFELRGTTTGRLCSAGPVIQGLHNLSRSMQFAREQAAGYLYALNYLDAELRYLALSSDDHNLPLEDHNVVDV